MVVRHESRRPGARTVDTLLINVESGHEPVQPKRTHYANPQIIHGMTCGGCTGSVQRALSKIDGVSQVEVSLQPGMATLEVDTARVTPRQIEAAISSLGYQDKLHPAQGPRPEREPSGRL
jgi:copper chaperone